MKCWVSSFSLTRGNFVTVKEEERKDRHGGIRSRGGPALSPCCQARVGPEEHSISNCAAQRSSLACSSAQSTVPPKVALNVRHGHLSMPILKVLQCPAKSCRLLPWTLLAALVVAGQLPGGACLPASAVLATDGEVVDPSARQIKPSSPLPNPVAPGVVLNASTLLAALEMLESADDSSHADGAPTQVVFLPNGSISIPTPGGNSTTAPQDASPVVVQDLDQAAGSGDGDGDFDDQELSRLSPEHGADLGATSSQSPGFFNGEEGTPATRPSVPVMTGASLVVHASPAPPLPPARALPPAPAPGEPSPAPEPSPESVGSATETVTALSPERNSSREGPLPLPYPKSSVDGSGKSQTIAIAVSGACAWWVAGASGAPCLPGHGAQP